MNQQLQDYIKKSKEAGFSDDQIKQELLKVGWKEEDINQAFINYSVPALTSVPQPVTTKKSRSKLPIVIAIVVLAAALIGGGILGYKYLVKPLKDELKNWKTYSDDLYGFQFKHPENLEKGDFGVTQELGLPAVSQDIEFIDKEKANAGMFSGVIINVYRSADIQKESLPNFGKCISADTLGQNEVSFGNKQALELVCSIAEQIKQYPDFYKDYNGLVVNREYIIEDADFTYAIHIAICDGDNKSEDCNKFISNFKFTAPTINLIAWGRIYKQNSDWYLFYNSPNLAQSGYVSTKVKLILDNAVCREIKNGTVNLFDPYKSCKEFNLKTNHFVGESQFDLEGGDQVGVEGTLNNDEVIVKRLMIQPEE